MKRYQLFITVLILSLNSNSTIPSPTKIPKLTLVMVIDQFAYHELQKLKKHFKGGIKYMLDNGISYENAFMPHAVPQTAVGHATLSTGALPKDHGYIGNNWRNKSGKDIHADDDSPEHAAVFSRNGLYNFGKSAQYLMVDGISDQVMFSSTPQKKHIALALSHKSHAAIAMASKVGKALWLDAQTGQFTSSKAYYQELPTWVTTFNTKKNIGHLKTTTWKLVHSANSSAYAFNNIKNYEFSGSWGFKTNPCCLAGREIPLDPAAEGTANQGAYELFAKTPAGNQLLIDFARACIDEYVDHQKIDHMLLWVSVSGLDKIGHPFGPNSLEAIDMLYHIDLQLQKLIQHANKRFGQRNVFFVLTADHGILPIPEIINQEGYWQARRIPSETLTAKLNDYVSSRYSIKNLITAFDANQWYLDHAILATLDAKQKEIILKDLKKQILKTPGIKKVWTFDELSRANYHLKLGDLEAYFRNQLFKGRSGQLICQTYPYNLITEHKTGTTHTSPYNYDTHIPLFVYQKGTIEKKRIFEKVWAQQVAPTIARILDIPKPSATTFEELPGIFD